MNLQPEKTNPNHTDDLNGYKEIQAKKFNKIRLTSFLEKAIELDTELEKFKQKFYEIYMGGLVEQVEGLQKKILEHGVEAHKLVTLGLLKQELVKDTFEVCNQLLTDLLENQSILSTGCYKNYVVPLIDTFWNFKSKLKNYCSDFFNPNHRIINTDSKQIEQSDQPHALFSYRDILSLILSFLSFEDIKKMSQVSKGWKAAVALMINLRLASSSLTENDIELLFKQPGYLQHVILKFMIEKKQDNKIKSLFKALHLPLSDRKKLEDISIHNYKSNSKDLMKGSLISNVGMTMYFLDILSVEQIRRNEALLCTQFALIAFYNQLIPFDLIANNLDSPVLKILLSHEYGIIAISKKLLTLQQVLSCGMELVNILTKNGLRALEKNWITPQFISSYPSSLLPLILTDDSLSLLEAGTLKLELMPAWHTAWHISAIFSKEGIIALQKKLLTQEQMVQFPRLSKLLTTLGLQALEEKLITLEQAAKIEDLSSLLSEAGLEAMRKGLIIPEQAAEFNSRIILSKSLPLLLNTTATVEDLVDVRESNLDFIASNEGQKLLKEKIISFEIAKKHSLAIFKIPNGSIALQEKLITLEQADKFEVKNSSIDRLKSLRALLSDIGLQAMKEGLITPEDALHFYSSNDFYGPQDNLHILLSKTGLIALRKKLITPLQASTIYELGTLLTHIPNVITAMEAGIISPDDFKFGEKLSMVGVTYLSKKLNIDKPISLYLNKQATKIQKCWRQHLDKYRNTLFGHVTTVIKQGKVNTENKKQVVEILQSIKENKLQLAEKQLTELEPFSTKSSKFK